MDINVDIGEGGSNDDVFMPYISICSIACGGHFGSFKTIKKTIKLALKHKVKIGSHPSYPDKLNFGRQTVSMNRSDFKECIRSQLLSFKKAINFFSIPWHHCKAHGALYNDMIRDNELAIWYFEVLKEFPQIKYLILPAGMDIVSRANSYKFQVIREVFSDRRYNSDLTLKSRDNKDSIINSHSLFLENLSGLLKGKVNSINKSSIDIVYDTICLHTDHEKSIDFIKLLSKQIKEKE